VAGHGARADDVGGEGRAAEMIKPKVMLGTTTDGVEVGVGDTVYEVEYYLRKRKLAKRAVWPPKWELTFASRHLAIARRLDLQRQDLAKAIVEVAREKRRVARLEKMLAEERG
jgi:hypothetical protein